MEVLNFCEHTLSWFKSYLLQRPFIVNIDNAYSNISKISCCVPQGSLVLFLTHSNDIISRLHQQIYYYMQMTSFKSFNIKKKLKLRNKWIPILLLFPSGLLIIKLSIHFGEGKTKCILPGAKAETKQGNLI